MSLLGGIEGQENFLRHHSPFFQLATSLDYKHVRTYLVPTMIFNSRKDGNLQSMRHIATHPEDNHTFSLGLGVDVAVTRWFSLAGEYVPRLTGFGGFGSKHPTVAAGIKIRTWRHIFTILLSSSRDFTPAGYGVNATNNDFALGFNIYRKVK